MKLKNIITAFLLSAIWIVSLSAQTTQEQATEIVMAHIQSGDATPSFHLYVNTNAPSADGISITTSQGETVRARYACWVYYLDENPEMNEPAQKRYFFVRENNGSLLEIITNNDTGLDNFASWKRVDMTAGFDCRTKNNIPVLFPNPVSDRLIVPCFGKQILVEIFDLNGNRLFSEFRLGESRLDVSFLNSGIYFVNISGETHRIIKN